MNGDRVEIGEKEKTFPLILHFHPVFDRTQIIAKMEITGGLDTRNCTHDLTFFLRGLLRCFFLRQQSDLAFVYGAGHPRQHPINNTADGDQCRD